ncbi:MAG TPA: ROK family protein [Acidimicrobiales bacterium]|nr:ROK family protein [Acidimicrobiales bacterium]
MSATGHADATIGVDIGGTKLFGVVLHGDDSVVAEARVSTPQLETDGSPWMGAVGADVAEAVATVVDELRSSCVEVGGAPVRVGIGAPGMVDRSGTLRFAPNLPSASGADLRGLVSVLVPDAWVVVENDANCAALAEQRLGSLRRIDHGMMVTLGTGIGVGLVVHGRVELGASGFAGEAGHMIVDPSGPACPCGRKGCWERYASGGGLGRLAREAAYAGRLSHVVARAGGDPENVHGEDITRAALEGDEGALGVLAELGWWVALGLANLVAVVDPERIVLGGGLAEAGQLLLEPTRRAFGELLEGGSARPAIDVVGAALGERAGAVGAALTARKGAGP